MGATSELSWRLLMVILWFKVALGMAFLSLKKIENGTQELKLNEVIKNQVFFQKSSKNDQFGFSGGPADERGVKICSRHVSSRFDSVVLVRGDFGSTCLRALRSSEK